MPPLHFAKDVDGQAGVRGTFSVVHICISKTDLCYSGEISLPFHCCKEAVVHSTITTEEPEMGV